MLRDAQAGRPATVFLAGAGGVGKTRLTDEAAVAAAGLGFAVARGRAFAAESGVPYAVFTDALLPLLRSLDAGALTVLTRGAGRELAPIVPPLFAAEGTDAAGDDPKARTYWALAQLLGRLAARRPLLMVLDNLHWADAASLELLHFVARQAQAGTIDGHLVILGAYAEPGEGQRALRHVEHSLVSLGAARRLPIEPLSEEAITELVATAFATPPAAIAEFAHRLHAWTRGNAFFVAETLKEMTESGRLVRGPAGWEGWGQALLAPSRTARDVVRDRAERLGAAARALLDLCAVLGTRAPISTLRAVSGLPADTLADALDELRRADFLMENEDGEPLYDFTHPLVRDAIHATIGRARVRQLHGELAAALERHHGAHAMAHAAEIAFHISRSGLADARARAAGYFAAAGRQALLRHADAAAAEYLEAALDGEEPASAEAGQRLALTEALADARRRLGEVAAAQALYERVRAMAGARGDVAAVARVERRLGLMAAAAGDPAGAVARHGAGLAVLGERDDALRVALLLARASALDAMGRRDDAVADARQALALAAARLDTALQARAHRALLLLHAWSGPAPAAREHGERAIALAAASGEREIEWSAHRAMAVHAGLSGDASRTAMHLRESQRLADAIGSPVLQLWTADVGVEYHAGTGAWAEALALAGRAIPAARALGQHTLLARLLVWTGLVHRGLGDLAQARACIEEAWAIVGGDRATAADARGDVHAVVPAYMGMTGYLVAVGEHARALEVGEAGLAIADRSGYVAWAIYRLLPYVIETSLYLEDHDRAARHNARLRRDSHALGHPLGLAWADTTDALLAYLRGDAAGAVPLLRAARAGLERVPFVFDAARLRRFIARALVDAGDREGAVAELREAHAIFTRLGAGREIGQTRDELRALGAKAPTAGTGAGEGEAEVLSVREMEVARLVAERCSNKEIGERLGISPRTVSTHLSNIFAKLGVESRGELTDLVRSGALGPEDRPA